MVQLKVIVSWIHLGMLYLEILTVFQNNNIKNNK